MRKGEKTKAEVLTTAIAMASQGGLDSITVGTLAERVGISKSGLFAHFGSREVLQEAVLDQVRRLFTETVVANIRSRVPGRDQLTSCLTEWMAWSRREDLPGGCPLASSFFEFDCSGSGVRPSLVDLTKVWEGFLFQVAGAARGSDPSIRHSPDQLVRLIFGLYLGFHVQFHLMGEKDAAETALETFRQSL